MARILRILGVWLGIFAMVVASAAQHASHAKIARDFAISHHVANANVETPHAHLHAAHGHDIAADAGGQSDKAPADEQAQGDSAGTCCVSACAAAFLFPAAETLEPLFSKTLVQELALDAIHEADETLRDRPPKAIESRMG